MTKPKVIDLRELLPKSDKPTVSPELLAELRKNAHVFRAALDIVTKNMPAQSELAPSEKLTFGRALELAQEQTKTRLSTELHSIMLRCLVRITMNQKLPGAPDA